MERAMSLCVRCNEAQPRSVLSNVTTTVVAVITAMTFSASGAAPTALYHQYQDSFGLTPFAITIIFAAYVLDRKSTRLNSSHANISYAVFCLKKKKKKNNDIILYNKEKMQK